MMKKSIVDIVFDYIIYMIMAVAMVISIYPLWYILIASLSSAADVLQGNVVLWIHNFTIEAYKKTLSMPNIGKSYLNTIFYSIVGTVVSMALSILGGYALSKKRLHGRKLFMILIMVTMWFNVGMMPTYITFRNLGLLDTRLAVILQGAVSSFYVIIMRTFFESMSDSMEEAAKLDGASDIQILMKIYLPLSTSMIMTISLYYFVERWNAYFWPMLLLRDESKLPLQVLLKKLIVEMNGLFENSNTIDLNLTSKDTMVYSTMVIAVFPMLAVYPYIQKFFIKGVMIGAVKG